MSPGRKTAESRVARRAGSAAGKAGSLSLQWAVLQGIALIVLALGGAWLMQRSETLAESRQVLARTRSLAELVAHAAGPDVTFEESPRLLRVLECATRNGKLEAAVIINADGTIVAHTDVARTGMQIAPSTFPEIQGGTPTPALVAMLFDDANRHALLHPLIGPQGKSGMVAVLLPEVSEASQIPGILRFFLPSGLLLLAFVVISQATVRKAVRPTSEFLVRLTEALDLKREDGDDDITSLQPGDGPVDAMQATVERVNALARIRDELLIKTRLVDYEKKRMELILDAFPDGLVVMSSVNDLVFINRRAMLILGLHGRREDIRNLAQVPGLLKLAQDAEKTGQALLPTVKNGVEQQILFNRIPLSTSESQSTHFLFTMRDVTAQQAAQRTQAEFLSQISHELKAPLNTIVTFVEELAENDELSAAERREYCNTLNGEAHRMAQLIGNLLQLSRIQLGNLSVNFAFVKPNALLRDQIDSLRVQAESRGLTFRVEVPDNLPALSADKDLLAVTINNLISNAIKYTAAGGEISVSASEADQGLLIRIEDSGMGITAEEREKIFERFYRGERARVHEQSGSGLGLSLVKEIVEIHGGEVTVESEEGQGSQFRIWLPAREVSDRLDTVEVLD